MKATIFRLSAKGDEINMLEESLNDVPSPSYFLRRRKVDMEGGKFDFKNNFSDIGLASKTKENALLEIKNDLDSGSLDYDPDAVYYLVESVWVSADHRKANTDIKEFILNIKKEGQYNWIVELVKI